jgi:replication factor A1
MISSSSMSVNPDNDEAFALRGWYDSIGVDKNFQAPARANMSGSTGGGFNRSEIRHLKDVKDSQLGQSDKADFFSTRATIMHIKSDNVSYPACPTENCNKKVIQVSDEWRCEKCDRSFESPEHRCVYRTLLFHHILIYLWKVYRIRGRG